MMMATLNQLLKNRVLVTVILVAIGIICVLIIFQPCNNTPSHKKEAAEVKTEKTKVDQREITERAKEVKWNAEIEKRDSVISVLTAKKQFNESTLMAERDKIKILSGKVIFLSSHLNDSSFVSEYRQKADSLAMVASGYTDLVQSYQQLTDTLYSQFKQQLGEKDSIIVSKEKLYADLRQSFDKVSTDYAGLYHDYGKTTSKAKWTKTLSRVQSAAILILLGALVIKK